MLVLKFTNVGTTTVSEIPVSTKELLNNALLNISGYIDSICLCLFDSENDNELICTYTYSYSGSSFIVKQTSDLPKDPRKIIISLSANEYINSILK
jgi:hypothetical protein